jgi:hypothetical protein
MTHAVTIGPSAASIVDADGKASPLPKPRSSTHRARCSCGWRGAERSSAEQARFDGDLHRRLMVTRA